MSENLLRAALDAAERGWHVFPLRPGGKPPALHGEKSCTRTGPCANGHVKWEQRATTDPDRIRAAWTRAPFNVGIATGPSGLVVIDAATGMATRYPAATHPLPLSLPATSNRRLTCAVAAVAEVADF